MLLTSRATLLAAPVGAVRVGVRSALEQRAAMVRRLRPDLAADH
jgi:hypothetical protein